MSDDIDVGQIGEALNDKVDRDNRNVNSAAGADAVIEYQMPTAENNYTWYRLYKSGWVEQGGYVAGDVSWSVITVNIVKEMADTNYTIAKRWVCSFAINPASYDATATVYNKNNITTSSFPTYNGTWDGFYWEVKGMSAQGV